ncbi:carboxylesterase/lipase family protein [Antrihabitans cavernicola]|uniref:Carboxylic ester hydrolase n=1 Tax=Antrihabitans cavernicola TaxID=2495913 RepID=A0A5A7SAX9_9NOCA|nr:carboxylesterase family protein [Spelaeibacter cavernicola]KAA0021685.1 carboxylesterase family protein [Spelaeibacter cavernicola]
MTSARILAVVIVAIAALTGCGSGESEHPAVDAPIDVTTTTGTVHGTATDAVRIFRGIRYAQPPIGERRWTVPQPLPTSSANVDATKDGSPCPQTAMIPGTPPKTDEDCLFLNVTTPRKQSPNGALPVMVWWHGGGYTNGSGADYDPQKLADKGNVIVVTVNYRLGIFGYFGLPGLAGSGNFGFADQIASLQWVKANANAFGGDAHNVTVFGQSAGGMSACALLTAPSAAGLFDKAAVMSGSCLLDWHAGGLFPSAPAAKPYTDATTNQASGASAADGLGCAGPGRLACMRAKPAADLIDLNADFSDNLAYGTELLPTDPAQAVEAGHVAHVPILSGGTADEARSFVAGAMRYDPNSVTPQTYPSLLSAAFGNAAPAVADRYPLAKYPSAGLAWASVVTDSAWACPTDRGNRVMAAQTSVYPYEFAEPNPPDVNGVASAGMPTGATHATDLPFLFQLAHKDLLHGDAQHALSDRMIEYWSTFARTGNPNSDRTPNWNPATPDSSTVQRLSSEGAGTVDAAAEHQCQFWSTVR